MRAPYFSRRQFLARLTILSTGLLAACAPAVPTSTPTPTKAVEQTKAVESQKPAPAATTPSKAKGVTIRMLAWAGYKGEGVKTWIGDFEKEIGGRVELDLVAFNQLLEKQIVTLSGKTGDFDVSTIDEPNLPALAPFLVQLDPYLQAEKFDKEDWVPAIWDAGVWEGKTYLIPFDPNVQILFARKDVLSAKGLKIPEKWTELFETAKKAQERDKELYGIVIMAKRDIQTGINAWTFITTWGNEIFDENYRVAFDNERGYDALAFYKKIVDEIAPPGAIGYDYAGINTAMQQGKAVFLQNWAAVALSIIRPPESRVTDKIAFAPALGEVKRHSMRGVWSLGINADSKVRDAAWEFTKWFTSKESSLKYVKGGSGNSPRLSVLESEEFRKIAPHAEALVTTFKMAKKRPIFKEYNEIQEVFDIMGSKVTTGEASPRDAVKEAAEKLNAIMRRAGYQK